MQKELEYCDHCGAALKSYWHALTPGIIRALIKALNVVRERNKNEFHLYDDLTGSNKLTTTEQMNWTKLRFHGLVAKVKENGEWKRGYWLITKRGGEFLRAKVEIPKKVQTFRNKVVDHSTELVTIRDVIDSTEYWQIDFPGEIFDPGQKALL